MAAKETYDLAAALPAIQAELEPYRRGFTLNVERAALLVVDMQNGFLDPKGVSHLPAAPAIVPAVAAVAAAFRRAGRPVFFTRHAVAADGGNAGIMPVWWGRPSLTDGTWDAELIPSLPREAGDVVIGKCRYSVFVATDLEQRLRQARAEDVVIAGVMTNLCCETSARDAFMRDFRVFFLADGTAAPTLAMHRASLLNLAYACATVTTADDVLAALAVK